MVIGYILILFSAGIQADNRIVDSLVVSGNYENALDVIKRSPNPDDSALVLYRLICRYKLNEKGFIGDLAKTIRNHDKGLYYNLMGSFYLEKGKLSEGLKEFEQAANLDPGDSYARFRMWEIQTIQNQNLFPITVNQSRFDTLSLLFMDSLDLGIYYLGTGREDSAITYFRMLSRHRHDIYKYHLYNYLLADKRNDYYEKDYEYQIIWRLSGSRGYPFDDQIRRYLLYRARRHDHRSYSVSSPEPGK